MKHRRFVAFHVILELLVVLLAAGCSQSIDIYVYEDGTWQAESAVVYETPPAGWSKALDNQMALPEEVTRLLAVDHWDREIFERGLETLVSVYGESGIDFQWKRGGLFNLGGKTRYTLSASGRKPEQIQQLFFDLASVQPAQDGTWRFSLQMGEINMYLRAFYQQTLTFHAGEVIDSDAPQVEGALARWPNPADAWIEYRPLPPGAATHSYALPPTALWIVGGLLALALIAGAVLLLANRSAPASRLPTRGPSRTARGARRSIRTRRSNRSH